MSKLEEWRNEEMKQSISKLGAKPAVEWISDNNSTSDCEEQQKKEMDSKKRNSQKWIKMWQ